MFQIKNPFLTIVLSQVTREGQACLTFSMLLQLNPEVFQQCLLPCHLLGSLKQIHLAQSYLLGPAQGSTST